MNRNKKRIIVAATSIMMASAIATPAWASTTAVPQMVATATEFDVPVDQLVEHESAKVELHNPIIQKVTPVTIDFDTFKNNYKTPGTFTKVSLKKSDSAAVMPFTLTKDGYVSINVKAMLGSLNSTSKAPTVMIANKSGDNYDIISQFSQIKLENSTSTTDKITNFAGYLEKGTYYIVFQRNSSAKNAEDGTVMAEVKCNYPSLSSSSTTEIDFGSGTTESVQIFKLSEGKTVSSFFGEINRIKYYNFTLKKDSQVEFSCQRFTFNHDGNLRNLYNTFLFKDENGKYTRQEQSNVFNTSEVLQKTKFNLKKGTYLFAIDSMRTSTATTPLLKGQVNVSYTATEYLTVAPAAPTNVVYKCGDTKISGKCASKGSHITIAYVLPNKSSATFLKRVATVDSSKKWSYEFSKPLPAGTAITVYAENPNGELNNDVSMRSKIQFLNSKTNITVNANCSVKEPTFNDSTVCAVNAGETLKLSGTKPAGTAIEITIYNPKNGETLRTDTVKKSTATTWSKNIQASTSSLGFIPDGAYIDIKAVDEYGNYSKIVRQYISSRPVIKTAAVGTNVISGEFSNKTASAVYVSTDNGRTFNKATCSGSKFTYKTATDLKAGTKIIAYATLKKPSKPNSNYICVQGNTKCSDTYTVKK